MFKSVTLNLKIGSFGLLILLVTSLSMACRTSREFKPAQANSINRMWDSLDLASKYHTGLSIFDLDKGKPLFAYHDDNYFTPGSNTKIFTLYTALRYLDDPVTSAYYKFNGDTVVIWGGGDPGTLYHDINGSSALIDFLKTVNQKIVFSDNLFKTERYGKGWSWDDYPSGFQCERTAFPIYGNRLWIDRYQDSISLTPDYFRSVLSVKKDTLERKGRNEWGNSYFYQYNPSIPEAHVTIPISFFKNDVRLIWSDAISKNITLRDVPLTGNVSQLKGTSRDTLLKWMMQESDNFIAEQLLLSSAMKQTGFMNEKNIIDKVLKGPLSDLPDSIDWVDGSGLSRYNMMTPRSLVWVLRQIIKQKGLDYVKTIFPAGGQSGTIAQDYKGAGQPYVWAKSGRLRHVYCLSGILITRSGKVLVFSWMNNLFKEDISQIKSSMESLFTYLRDQY